MANDTAGNFVGAGLGPVNPRGSDAAFAEAGNPDPSGGNRLANAPAYTSGNVGAARSAGAGAIGSTPQLMGGSAE